MATTGEDGPADENVLHIRYRESDVDRVIETLAALDRGETPEPYFEVVYNDPADLHLVTRPKNVELLRAIVRHEPESIRETARLVERDVRQVHRNLSELADLHLIELEQDGQSKRPRVWYDGIELDLPLVESEDGAGRAES